MPLIGDSYAARKRFDELLALAIASGGGPPPPPANVESVFAFAFTFLTPVSNLGGLPAGTTWNRSALLITTPFNDPSATLSLGTFGGSPTAFMAPGDSRLSQAGQYDLENLVALAGADALRFALSPGASTQGAGLLLYKYLP